MKILELIAPKLLVSKAWKRLSQPLSVPLRPHEKEVLLSARRAKEKVGKHEIATYTWGFGPKKILLVHGWEGHSGNFAGIVPLLIDKGYTVFSFDAPGHGKSSKGPVSLFDFQEVMSEFLKRDHFESMISHSFGSVPLTHALSLHGSYPVNMLVMITTPDTLTDRVNQIVHQLKLTQRTSERILAKFKVETGHDPHDLSVSNFVGNINANRAIIFHGSEDRVLPLEWSQRIAQSMNGAELRIIDGAGHYRILYDQELLRQFDQLFAS